MKAVRFCKGCGGHVPLTPTGRLRAHKCPHAAWCIPPYALRRRGARGKSCEPCFASRQLELPYVG